ncbi:hypothetical protein BST91_01940 [Nonlabens tegetincola]|uniref:reprolysin-like metallopeptidase n=1 Tax=Nonlabens tegetincola TaxID=323273 RepID=UPI000A205A9B|nr:zinc-dependent metalloprotease family protein [Nonlabens tegetincola]ARN70505.1 hypothetical protein BST91_01940 [Nonlabens tegetincola]
MKRLLSLLCLLISFTLSAQSSMWQSIDTSELPVISEQDRPIKPLKFDLIQVDASILSQYLTSAPDRFDGRNGIIVDLPVSEGKFESFEVFNSGSLSKGFANQYPNIQSFIGKGIDNPKNVIYFTITSKGFHGVIRGEKITYIDPYSKSTPNIVMIYDRNNLTRSDQEVFDCHVEDTLSKETIDAFESSTISKAFRDRVFRTYRIAIAATGEYTAYHDDGNAGNGDAVADALAGIAVTLTRVNSVFEQEMSIRFTLVANNSAIVFTNAGTDPYDNYSGGQMIGANTNAINSRIGSTAYDIGHVFSTGGGGIASAVRCSGSKAQGVTGIVTPEFDPFDIDYVSHEIGHQFGASHTFYNGCFGGSPSSAPVETGSASTIMGYAGICAPNVQDNSDAYFHLISLFQMHNELGSDTCELEQDLNGLNASAPNSVSLTNKTIPRNTPFKLTGISTQAPDPGETYTYNWEQLDNGYNAGGYTGATQPPLSSNNRGPVFRTLFPTTSPTRYFPNLNDLVNNVDPTWETLPNVQREMRFFCTIRDNNINGGQSDFAGVTLTVGASAAFSVSSPNTGSELWYEGENVNITWNEAGTNNTTYATQVNILLSTDGGYTYPITLASNVNNDGSQIVNIPTGVKTTQARIMIEAVDNYFFDISNQNFEIKEGTFELNLANDTVSSCSPSDAVFSFDYVPAPGFSETATFSTNNLPANLNVNFTPASTSATGTIQATISNTAGVDAGRYEFDLITTTSSATIVQPMVLKIFDGNVGQVNLTSPINGAGNQVANPLLVWDDLESASGYLVEISEQSDFSTVVESAAVFNVTQYQPTLLESSKIYFWRITPSNDCTTGTANSISAFQTAQDVCNTYGGTGGIGSEYYENNDNIWNTNSNNAVSARVQVTDDIEITQVSFYMNATHSDTGDLKMQLSSPTGRFSEVYNRECAAGRNFDLTVSDSGTEAFGCNPGYTGAITGVRTPGQAFSRFNGSSAQGEWVLLATDREADSQGGTFNEFSVTVCGRLQYVNDIDNNRNNLLTLGYNATSIISNTLLRTQKSGTTNANMTYVITSIPEHGRILLLGSALNLGDTFTQSDINQDRISYEHTSTELVYNDSFGFIARTPDQAVLEGKVFNIEISEPTLIYSGGAWSPFQPNLETLSLNAVVIDGSATLSAAGQIKDLTVQSGGTLELADNLLVSGDMLIDGNLTGLTNGNLEMSSSNLQTISGSGDVNLYDMTVQNTTGVLLNSNVNIYNVLNPNNSSITTNGNLTFKNDATRVGQLDNANQAIFTGNVTVENYFPARRAFRFMASSVNTSNGIYNNYQNGGVSESNIGTHITGNTSGANGLDATSTGNSNMFYFDNTNQAWVAEDNTLSNQLEIGKAFRLLVRGDRSVDLSSNTSPATITTLVSEGQLQIGDFNQAFPTSNGEFLMIANPYQAIVDVRDLIAETGTTGINPNFVYVWDTNLNARGGYSTVDVSGPSDFVIPSSNASSKIRPGQSIFMLATGPSNIAFKESHKAVNEDLSNVFRSSSTSSFVRIELLNSNTQQLLDESIMLFDSSFDDNVTAEDAIKFTNQDETLGIIVAGQSLAIAKNNSAQIGNVYPLSFLNQRGTDYTFSIEIQQLDQVQPVLVDNYLMSRTPLQSGINNVNFNIDSNVQSQNPNRFNIEFETVTLSNGDVSLDGMISLYPNPVKDILNIELTSILKQESLSINVTNMLGQAVLSKDGLGRDISSINLGSLASGTYILTIDSQLGSYATKLVKE